MKLQQKGFDEFALIIIAAVIFIGIFALYVSSSFDTEPRIQPREISLFLLPNEKASLTVKIMGNSSNASLDVEGAVSNFVSLSEKNFQIFGEKEVKVNVKAPSYLGTFSGYLRAKTNGGEDKIPIKLVVSNSYNLAYRSITYPPFRISNYGKGTVVDSRENDFVEKSIFKDKKIKLVLQLNETEIEEAYVVVLISDVQGPGEFLIKQNGELLLVKKVDIGEIKVKLNTSKLGSINFISLEASNPPWNIFGATRYEIYSAKIIVRYKGAFQIFDLNLNRNEIERFHSIEFSSLVQSSYPIPTLEIRVNDQIVYMQKLPMTGLRINITKDILGERLILSENNKISFYLVDEGYINFDNNIIKIYYRE
ncbi:MAG: hypothetical protein QXX30_03955 [Candidatus Aenigmatarchaeota archaeon]